MGVKVTALVPDAPAVPVVADVLVVVFAPLEVVDGPEGADPLVSRTSDPVRKPCTRLSRLLLEPANFS